MREKCGEIQGRLPSDKTSCLQKCKHLLYCLHNCKRMTTSTAQERNPFADGASMLLRVALSERAKAWGIRELSRMAGTSPALTLMGLRRLERMGLVSREMTAQARILDPVQILRDWAAWYAVKPIKSRRFSISGHADPIAAMNLLATVRPRLSGQWALTSMAGASLVAPHATFSEIHIHSPKADELRRSWQDVLRLEPDEQGPIHLIQPYYAGSGLFEMQAGLKLPVVSNLQLYLDCYCYPVRGREQAEHILSQKLLPRWESAR